MKTFIASILIASGMVGYSTIGFAADQMGLKDYAGIYGQAPAELPLVDGLVRNVDKAKGKVTLTHGPLPNGMPGMTMAFSVKEVAWLDLFKEGLKIRFAADEVNGAMTVVRFEPVRQSGWENRRR